MIDNAEERSKVFLVTADTGAFDAERSMNELEELADTAGADAVAKIIQKRPSIDTGTCIGQGKLLEIKDLCEKLKPSILIFDHELTATQIRNIEDATDVRTIDRTTLILDIFAQRAKSAEGKIQVELAQQQYRLTRLAGMGVSLSRLGGGIGTRGPGESKLETDKRHIRRRISFLKDELLEMKRRRELGRAKRKKDNITTVAIVGYTNVGKSTLLNSLTDAGVLAENKLFATLDTTSRALTLPDGRNVLLIDTVGLISRLPHNLVEAFKSTLEEAASADLILHVIDASTPDSAEQTKVTEELLCELGCDNIPKINVINKTDLVDNFTMHTDDKNVVISAKNKEGLSDLLIAISHNLPESTKRMSLLIPFAKQGLLNLIRQDGKIFNEEYTEAGTLIDALVDIKILPQVSDFSLNTNN